MTNIASNNSQDTQKLDILQFGANEYGEAEAIRYVYDPYIVYSDVFGWMYWTGTHWTNEQAEAKINRMAFASFKARRRAALAAEDDSKTDAIAKSARLTATNRNNVKSIVKDYVTVSHRIFDADIYALNCANGVLDLRTGQLSPHSPDQRFTYCIATEYDPSADYSMWKNWLADTVGSSQVADYLQTAIGYSLTGDIREECLFYIFGKPRAGKGTFTETILAMMSPLARTINFESLTASRSGNDQNFDLAPLRASRAIFAGEGSKRNPLNAAKIKQITGGDEITCAFKGKDFFTYRPQFKAWLSSNWKVNTDVDDIAAWSRLRVIEFVNSYLGKEDKALKQRMRSAENLQAVLAWAVAGAVAWYSSPYGLSEPTEITTAREAHRSELDNVQRFIDDDCKLLAGSRVVGSLLYLKYESWCNDNGVHPKKRRAFTIALSRKNIHAKKAKVKGKVQRVYTGIELLD